MKKKVMGKELKKGDRVELIRMGCKGIHTVHSIRRDGTAVTDRKEDGEGWYIDPENLVTKIG